MTTNATPDESKPLPCPRCRIGRTRLDERLPSGELKFHCSLCDRYFFDQAIRPLCHRCSSENVVRNGKDREGRQQFRCRECRRRFLGTASSTLVCPGCQSTWVVPGKRMPSGAQQYHCHDCREKFAVADSTKSGPSCPGCAGRHVVRNGTERSGTQKFLCRDCGRKFVDAPKRKPIDDGLKNDVRQLLIRRWSLRKVAKEAGVSRAWIYRFLKGTFGRSNPIDRQV